MATIYSKTADGQNEIETRARKLSPRARSALILVDGKRSTVDLGKLVQQADETLQALLEAGLIEVVAVKSAPARDSSPAPLASAAAASPAPASGMALVEFEATRRDAVRAINDLLGPEAENLALKLERSTDAEQLRAALERAVAYIANARGGGAAAQFAGKFLSNLQG
jgi:hypothetical protein